MAHVYEEITDRLTAFVEAQPVFFVATAPLDGDGHVNLSPKGMAGTFAVLGPHRAAYLDYTASGAETAAHLRENGRIVLMFCAFSGPPKIVRLHGRGRYVEAGTTEFAELRTAFPKERELGQRGIVVVDVTRVSDSCGFAVPVLDFVADRDILDRSHERRTPEYFEAYRRERNATSIDGLPAVGADVGTSAES
ncbi:pyridoxamine 5'-phosphate oxidase-related protein FMN-binding [Beutenbergia cavernae DSM 12333]|uniref:Pyridoxamine 5'-phosphate oxidase-related protein FMN-binding n=1 Tax=Beutenbergia cavernae (strain ATCC BAA-8 / DSM 12333 / CCUG 43141 / JCM 11478 / NBRC 16432 / NCIMB 13614 / HKI 0122) TaxID=471853 RepID=C5C326_BEUC1|nr:pyridoxamine 5'-phosphate oxidase family protein [Beutenbergia cavernae]ACQ81870.1 pyridoxamine 5'-phosphate oxidase-related protein FMN-binding [Beutenbergia cavernae DSM 12333]